MMEGFEVNTVKTLPPFACKRRPPFLLAKTFEPVAEKRNRVFELMLYSIQGCPASLVRRKRSLENELGSIK